MCKLISLYAPPNWLCFLCSACQWVGTSPTSPSPRAPAVDLASPPLRPPPSMSTSVFLHCCSPGQVFICVLRTEFPSRRASLSQASLLLHAALTCPAACPRHQSAYPSLHLTAFGSPSHFLLTSSMAPSGRGPFGLDTSPPVTLRPVSAPQ